ncbi:MAG: hypothetical protein KF865_13765 [Bdellovibrionaceae bacterium]|nr:hypothetical protein [Pseudobdellovibrionaceae bacterium]
MKKLLVLMALTCAAGGASAADVVKGDLLIRTLQVGETSMVLLKQPAGVSGRSMVNCLPDLESAQQMLSQERTGGLLLMPGSKVTVKNDTSRSFNDGSQVKSAFIRFECKAAPKVTPKSPVKTPSKPPVKKKAS